MADPRLFWIAGAAALLGSLGVVAARSPIRAALSLAVTLVSTAALFLSLQGHLVAAVQVMVYAGAILVLIVFTVMLLNLRDPPADDLPGPLRAAGAAAVAGTVLAALAVWIRGGVPTPPAAVGEEFGTAATVGWTLLAPGSRFVYAFELTSLLLLAALVGAIALGRTRDARRRT